MSVQIAHHEKNGHIRTIRSHLEDMLDNVSTTDFKGSVGCHFKGYEGYQNAYEFASRHKGEDYDILLIVKVRQDEG